MRKLLHIAVAALAACRSPDEVSVGGGQQWFNTEESSWQGPAVGLEVSWDFGARRASYEDLAAVRRSSATSAREIDELGERQGALLADQGIDDPVAQAPTVPLVLTSDDWLDQLARLTLDPARWWVPLAVLGGLMVIAIVAKKYRVNLRSVVQVFVPRKRGGGGPPGGPTTR